METTHNSVKVKLGIKVMKLVESLIGREVTVGQGSECHLTFVRGLLHIAQQDPCIDHKTSWMTISSVPQGIPVWVQSISLTHSSCYDRRATDIYIYTNEKKKKTVYCKNVNNSQNMQRMSMKIYKHGVPDTYIYLSNFYAFSCASRASSLLCMKTTFYVLCYRKTTCNKINWCKTYVYGAYNSKTTLLLLISAYRWRHTILKISFCGKMQHARE